MIRTCDGTDPNLAGEDGEPCACGMTFDDVRRRVVWPHEPVNAAADLAPHEPAIRRALEFALANAGTDEHAAPYAAALAILDDLKGPARTSLVTVRRDDLGEVLRMACNGPEAIPVTPEEDAVFARLSAAAAGVQ